MERWLEHYQEIFPKENVVTDVAIEKTCNLPFMMELDTLSSIEDLKKPVDSLMCSKAPGKDSIPPGLIKIKRAITSTLLLHLHQLLLPYWEEGTMPPGDVRCQYHHTLYKKDYRSICNSYCGISLLSSVGKAFAHVALNRLQQRAECVYPEAQCMFRSGRSIIDVIFSLLQLQENAENRDNHYALHSLI